MVCSVLLLQYLNDPRVVYCAAAAEYIVHGPDDQRGARQVRRYNHARSDKWAALVLAAFVLVRLVLAFLPEQVKEPCDYGAF